MTWGRGVHVCGGRVGLGAGGVEVGRQGTYLLKGEVQERALGLGASCKERWKECRPYSMPLSAGEALQSTPWGYLCLPCFLSSYKPGCCCVVLSIAPGQAQGHVTGAA